MQSIADSSLFKRTHGVPWSLIDSVFGLWCSCQRSTTFMKWINFSWKRSFGEDSPNWFGRLHFLLTQTRNVAKYYFQLKSFIKFIGCSGILLIDFGSIELNDATKCTTKSWGNVFNFSEWRMRGWNFYEYSKTHWLKLNGIRKGIINAFTTFR